MAFGRVIEFRNNLNEGEIITDRALNVLNNNTISNGYQFLEKLGLNILNPGDKVEDSYGVPRVFLFKGGKTSSLEEEGLEVGSKAFWKAAMKGQVFAYPAGGKFPNRIGNEKDMKNLEDGIDKLIDKNGLDKLSTKDLSDLLSGEKKEYESKSLADKLADANTRKAVQQEANHNEIVKNDLQADNNANILNI